MFIASGMMRGAGIALLCAIALGIVAAACGDQEGGAPTTPPSPTPYGAPRPLPGETGGDDGFRAFAAALDDWVRKGSIKFIAFRYAFQTKTCTAEDVGRDDTYCPAAGHTYEGMPFGRWRSEGAFETGEAVSTLLRDRFRAELPTAQDAFGSGGAQIAAINVQQDRYAAVITMLIPRPPEYGSGGPIRVAIGTSWRFDGERWRMTGGLNAGVLAEDLLTPGLAESPYANLELFGTRDPVPSR